MNPMHDVIIIGGGQAGLVQGYYLQQHNIDFIILDANASIGGSWHQYWDSVTLFSSAKYSSLDGLPFPDPVGDYPTRQEVIAYLQQYAEHFSLPVIHDTKVKTVHQPKHFEVITEDGICYSAHAVIVATGAFTKPNIPHITGQQDFTGQQIHSYHYHRPEPYTGQQVVVVGSNNSAMQIAYELAQVADVSMAVRKHIKFRPSHYWGIEVFFFLHDTGFDMLPIGCRLALCVSDSVYDDGSYQAAVAAGNPNPRPMFTQMTHNGVIWADGTEEAIDTILYATGFSANNKPFLCDLDALDADGIPIEHQGVSSSVDGLYYIGLEGQIAPASATLRGVSRDARYIAEKVATQLSVS